MKLHPVHKVLVEDMTVQKAMEHEQLWRENLSDPKDLTMMQVALAKLAKQVELQNAALKPFATFFHGDLSAVGGGTHVCPSYELQVFKDAKAAYLDLPTTEEKSQNEKA